MIQQFVSAVFNFSAQCFFPVFGHRLLSLFSFYNMKYMIAKFCLQWAIYITRHGLPNNIIKFFSKFAVTQWSHHSLSDFYCRMISINAYRLIKSYIIIINSFSNNSGQVICFLGRAIFMFRIR